MFNIPIALLALTISAFAIGTTEFVIVGLLPTIAQDLGVNLPSAGLLVSLYALGVAIGAPVLTALTGKVPRKTLLLTLMVLFTLGNLLAWKAPGYETLVVARILTGLAHGVFFSIGSTIATSLVPKEKAASAIAIMFTGLTVALVTGVPLGTFIGQHFGWRETFLAVSALGLVAGGLLILSTWLTRQGMIARAAWEARAIARNCVRSRPGRSSDRRIARQPSAGFSSSCPRKYETTLSPPMSSVRKVTGRPPDWRSTLR